MKHHPITDAERLNLAGEYNKARDGKETFMTLDEYIFAVRRFAGFAYTAIKPQEEDDDHYVMRNDLDAALDRLTE